MPSSTLTSLPSKPQLFTTIPPPSLHKPTHLESPHLKHILTIFTHPRHHIHPSLRQHPPTHTHSKALSDPHAFPIDIPSPPAFFSLPETPGQPASAAAGQTGGQAGRLQGRGGAGPDRVLPFCPLPQASSRAPAWSAQWGPSPTTFTPTLATGPLEVFSQPSEASYFWTFPPPHAISRDSQL